MRKKILFFLNIFSLGTLVSLIASYPSGQHFIFDPPATYDHEILRTWLTQTKPAGIILFAGHCTNRTKTKELIDFFQQEAQKLGIPPLIVALDWEGGIISRPNEAGGFASTPSPWSLAQSGRSACFLAGMLIGQQMRSIGATMNFAPSLDLFFPDNHILATRCFASDPEHVATYGIAFAKGLLTQEITPVFKHFPGLGLGKADTHFASTQINTDKQSFMRNVYPFLKALELDTPIVMCTHAIVNKFGKLPITLSTQAIDYMRSKNPRTLFITDDFSMKAVQDGRTIQDAAIQALTAGHHLIIFSGTPQDQYKLIEDVTHARTNLNAKQQALLTQRHEEIKAFKNKKQLLQQPPHLDEQQVAHTLAQQCVQLKKQLLSLHNKPVIMLTTNLPAIRPPEHWFIKNEKSYLRQLLHEKNINVREHILNPLDQASVNQLTDLIKTIPHDSYIITQTFFYADNIWNTIQKQWLELLQPSAHQLIMISLGHPKEETILPNALSINLGSFQQPVLTQAAHLLTMPPSATGADQLANNLSTHLQNKRFGLLCHRCSVTSKQEFLPDILHQWSQQQHDKTKLSALFSPEHGLFGTHEAFAFVDSEQQSKWHCPIYSLHGNHRKPTKDMLKNLDLLIVDLQEVGVRCFTYLSSLYLTLEACAEAKIPLLVLDRPNPLAHWKADGPILEKKYESFVGKVYTPFLHGLTIGKLAQKINESIKTPLSILESTQTIFTHHFIPPSPNLMSREHLLVYPLSVFIEGTNYSEGRGTWHPFLQIGAPWVDKHRFAEKLNTQQCAGVYFEPLSFIPQHMPGFAENPKHANTECHGVFIHLYNQEKVNPLLVAQTILKTLFNLYPQKSEWVKWGNHYAIDLLAGTDQWRNEII